MSDKEFTTQPLVTSRFMLSGINGDATSSLSPTWPDVNAINIIWGSDLESAKENKGKFFYNALNCIKMPNFGTFHAQL